MPYTHIQKICVYLYVGSCQNYGPFLAPYYNMAPNMGYPKRGHNFDNHAYLSLSLSSHVPFRPETSSSRVQDSLRTAAGGQPRHPGSHRVEVHPKQGLGFRV